MNKDGHSIFEKYKNTSAKQQIVEEGMKDVLKSRNSQVVENLNGEAAKKTVKMSYGDFLAKYKKSIAKYTADFIDDDPENEDEAEQMAVDAVIDDLEHQGIHVELILKSEDDEAGDPKHPDYKERKALIYQNNQRIGHEDYQRASRSYNNLNHPGEIRKKFGVGGTEIKIPKK